MTLVDVVYHFYARDEAKTRTAERLVNDLQFVNYSWNREYSPEISAERWAQVFGPDAEFLEARYQRERNPSMTILACTNEACSECDHPIEVVIRNGEEPILCKLCEKPLEPACCQACMSDAIRILSMDVPAASGRGFDLVREARCKMHGSRL